MTRLKSVQERVDDLRASLQNATEDDRLSIDDVLPLSPEEEAEDMYREIQAMAIFNGVPLDEMLRRCSKTVREFKIDEFCLKNRTDDRIVA